MASLEGLAVLKKIVPWTGLLESLFEIADVELRRDERRLDFRPIKRSGNGRMQPPADRTKLANQRRSGWSQGRGPRGMRASKARSEHSVGLACHRRWAAYGKPSMFPARRHTPEVGAVCGKAARTGSVRGAHSNMRPYRDPNLPRSRVRSTAGIIM